MYVVMLSVTVVIVIDLFKSFMTAGPIVMSHDVRVSAY